MHHFLKLLGLLVLCISGRDHYCVGFSTSAIGRRTQSLSAFKLPLQAGKGTHSTFSPGISRRHGVSGTKRRTSSLYMVLTTPIDIIEQASTVNLLDDLIDESVRTSARRPIIRQFDPSSGWVSSVNVSRSLFFSDVAKHTIC